jgi:hypothetical protein
VTNTARGLFEKLGWNRVEEILYHGEEVTLYVRSTSSRIVRHPSLSSEDSIERIGPQ